MKISAHCLVRNEARFVWYSIMSVIDYVDEVLVWDNGSTDLTSKIVHLIRDPKIRFSDAKSMPLESARNAMIDATDADWIFVLDGDEIWYDDAMFKVRQEIGRFNDQKDCMAVSNYMLVGDMFHYQEEKAGRYEIACKKGHLNVRAIRKTGGLHVEGVYGNEAFVTGGGVKVQNLPSERILSIDSIYLHTSFLKRGKHEIGEKLPLDFYYPEVFFRPRPEIVPSVWETMNANFKSISLLETPLRKIYRRTLLPFKRHGY